MGTGARDWAILQSTVSRSPPSAWTGVTVGYTSDLSVSPGVASVDPSSEGIVTG